MLYFLFNIFYVWHTSITSLIFLYCVFNQVLNYIIVKQGKKEEKGKSFIEPSFATVPSSPASAPDSCLSQQQLEPGTNISPIDTILALLTLLIFV